MTTISYVESLDKTSILGRISAWWLKRDDPPTQLPRDTCNFDAPLRDPATPLPTPVRVVAMPTPENAPLTGALKELSGQVAKLASAVSAKDDRLKVVISVEDGKVVDTTADFAEEEYLPAEELAVAAVAAALEETQTAPPAAEAPEPAAVEVVGAEAEAPAPVQAAEPLVETPVEAEAPAAEAVEAHPQTETVDAQKDATETAKAPTSAPTKADLMELATDLWAAAKCGAVGAYHVVRKATPSAPSPQPVQPAALEQAAPVEMPAQPAEEPPAEDYGLGLPKMGDPDRHRPEAGFLDPLDGREKHMQEIAKLSSRRILTLSEPGPRRKTASPRKKVAS